MAFHCAKSLRDAWVTFRCPSPFSCPAAAPTVLALPAVPGSPAVTTFFRSGSRSGPCTRCTQVMRRGHANRTLFGFRAGLPARRGRCQGSSVSAHNSPAAAGLWKDWKPSSARYSPVRQGRGGRDAPPAAA